MTQDQIIEAGRRMREFQKRYDEASRTNRFPASLWDEKRAAEEAFDKALASNHRQPSLF